MEKEIFFTPSSNQVEVLKGAILVKFKEQVSVNVKKSIFSKTGTQDASRIEKLGIDKIKIPDDKTVNEMVDEFSQRSDVLYAEPVYLRRAFMLPTEYADESELKNRQWGLEKIEAPHGWNIETGNGVVVAVLDTGIDLDHTDLSGNIWSNPDSTAEYNISTYTIVYDTHGWNFIDNNKDPDDDNNHGTHCAGIIGAMANNSTSSGAVGISWYNKLMAVKVLDNSGEGDSVDIINGIIYAADRGADIISMSLGGNPQDPPSEAERDAVNYAYNKGCVIAAASGNHYDSQISYPAGYENVIAVGATDINDKRANTSNYGEGLDIVAPGVNIYSTIIGGYDNMDGTSMACPYVAGLASIVISLWERKDNPGWTPLQVRNVITSNCDDINSASYPGWDKYTGYGRINVRSTLEFVNSGVVNISDNEVLVYPNPFNPDFQRAHIVLPKDNSGMVRKLRIYSLDGQEVREVGGSGSVAYWDGKNNDGEICATGLYFYYLDTTLCSEKGKITLIR